MQMIFPNSQELWVAFLSGGIIGVGLFRLWTMIVTSVIGAIFIGTGALLALQELGQLQSEAWARQHAVAVNGAIIIASLVGVWVQAKWHQRQSVGDTDEQDLRHLTGGKPKNPKRKAPKTQGDNLLEPHTNDHGPNTGGSKRSPWRLFSPSKY
jgi:hypothetical protein